MDSVSSTWTTLKSLHRHQTLTHLSGTTLDLVFLWRVCRKEQSVDIKVIMIVSSRRRSSSLGSCDDDKEELTSAQLTKRIHVLKKKIHRFEERFEEERKYRVGSSDRLLDRPDGQLHLHPQCLQELCLFILPAVPQR